MRKTLIVAQAEFGTLVRSKALIISIILMPVVMVISIVLTRATKDVTDNKDRTFAFVDYTGVLGEPLKAVARVLSPTMAPLTDRPAAAGARFIPIEVKPGDRN